MRGALIALCLALAACAAARGAADAPAPFTSQTTAPSGSAAASYAPINAPAGAYRLDRRHASLYFRIRHMELAWFTARFDTMDATLELDPADPTRSRLEAAIEAGSVNTNVSGFDQQVADALGRRRTAQIQFVSTAIERTGEFTARVTGDLTMNGRTHPATLEATFAGAAVDPLRGGAMVVGFSAHGAIDRTQWGVTNWRAFAGDDVQIVIEAEFVRAG